MNIENIKPAKDDFVIIKKKTIGLLTILIVLGLITGLILSNFFYNEANQKIDNYNEEMKEWYQKHNNSSSINNESTENSSYTLYLKKLTQSDVVLPSLGVVSICIAIYLLIGIIIAYISIIFKSKSPYIFGLLLVFLPLLIISLFLLNTLRALYFSSALKFSMLGSALGFGVGGLGGIISILSLILIVGLCILFYLTNE